MLSNTVPPRPLTERERRGLVAIGDVLIPDGTAGVRPSRLDGFKAQLDCALAARADRFEQIAAVAERCAELPPDRLASDLRAMDADPESGFQALSAVVAGAYLLVPSVREAIGYPGQAQRPPRFDEAAEQIMDGILEPVVERGPVYRPIPEDA